MAELFEVLIYAGTAVGLFLGSAFVAVKLWVATQTAKTKVQHAQTQKSKRDEPSGDFLAQVLNEIDNAPRALEILTSEEAKLKARGPLTKEQQALIDSQRSQLQSLIKYSMPLKIGLPILGPSLTKKLTEMFTGI